MGKKKSTTKAEPVEIVISEEKHKKKRLFAKAKQYGATDLAAAMCADGLVDIKEIVKRFADKG